MYVAGYAAVLVNLRRGDNPFYNQVMLASRMMLITPIHGFLLRLWGFESVNKENMVRHMKNGKNIGLIPGGFEEATLSTASAFRIYIKNRKGFIKMALQYGYKISPVLTLG